jgi:hypothetical protein
MESKEFTASLIQTLKSARQERARFQAETVTLENLIAGLELALDGDAGSASSQTKRPSPARTVAARRRVNSKRGEIEKAIVAAMVHYNGKEATTVQLAKVMEKNKPASLARKHVTAASFKRRALNALSKLESEGRVKSRTIAGQGHDKFWSFVA